MKARTLFFGACACIVTFYMAYQVGTGINESTSGPTPTQIQERENKVSAAVKDGKVFIGMSSAEVERSWGKPERVNRTTTSAGTKEQWVYKGGQYLYFVDNRLTAIQN